jgi:hypothetical protein
MGYYSDCCGAEATDPVMLDMGLCPECLESCGFEMIDNEPSDDQIYNNFNHEGGIKFNPNN